VKIITRAEARELGLRHYFSGRPCKHGHLTNRFTSTGNCCECYRSDRSLEKRKEWKESNIDHIREWHKAHAERNKDKLREYQRDWYKANRSRVKEKSAEYARNNRAAFTARANRRRASLLAATPVWLTDEDSRNIQAVYMMSERLAKCVGIPHEVDHIVPLKSELVCGLHVPWNLAAIPKTLNRSKGNRLKV